MFISSALAQDTMQMTAGTSMAANILQILLIFAVFYILLIRPQQKKLKQHEADLKAIKKGDEIITAGGVYAKVISADDEALIAEIAKGVEVKVYRYTVREVIKNQPLGPANMNDKKSKTKGKKHV